MSSPVTGRSGRRMDRTDLIRSRTFNPALRLYLRLCCARTMNVFAMLLCSKNMDRLVKNWAYSLLFGRALMAEGARPLAVRAEPAMSGDNERKAHVPEPCRCRSCAEACDAA